MKKKLLLKNWRDIKTKKAQFAGLIILVALGITSYIAFTSGYQDLTASYNYAKEKLKFGDVWVQVTSAPVSAVDELKTISGVAEVEGRLVIDTGIEADNGQHQAAARVISLPTDRRPSVNNLLIIDGNYLTSGSSGEALIDTFFADELGITPGSSVALIIDGQRHSISIKGIIKSPEYLISARAKEDLPMPGDFAIVFMPQKDVEQLFGLEPSYNNFSLKLADDADIDSVIAKVESTLKEYQVISIVKQEDQPSNFKMLEEIKQNEGFAFTMPFLILIISSFTLYITLARLVQSQRGQIGLSKALGYSNKHILFHYLIFSLFIALAGSIIGFGLGQYGGAQIASMYSELLGIPFLEHNVYVEQIFIAVALSIFFCVIAGLIPAYASARMKPAMAMHSDPSISMVKGKVPVIERIINKVFKLPFTITIPLRNIFRVKKRSLYTILGIAFAMILIISTWAFVDAVDYFTENLRTTEKWNVQAFFKQQITDTEISQVATWQGVEKVQAALMVPATLKTEQAEHETIITASPPQADFHGFSITEGDNPEIALQGDGMIMPPAIAEKLGVVVGDRVTVDTPYSDEIFTFTLISINDVMIGAPVFINIDEGMRLVSSPKTVYNVMYVNTVQGQDSEIRKQLFALSGVSRVVVNEKFISQLEEMMQLALAFFAIMFAFGFAMAFIITYNTFTTNILERSREIATMRTIGEDRWHLAASITLENIFLTIVGVPIGLILGTLAAQGLFEAFSTEAYSLTAIIKTQSYIYAIISIFIILIISEIGPIRRIFKLDLAEETKTLE